MRSSVCLMAEDLCCAAIRADVEGVLVAEGFELGYGLAAAHAALAMEQEYLTFLIDLSGDNGFDLAEGNVDGLGQMARGELTCAAHIDDQGAVAQVFRRGLGGDLSAALPKEKGDQQDNNDC